MLKFGKKIEQASRKNPSLVRRVVVWCWTTLACFCAATALGSFAIGYERATELQDNMLKEVVGILSRDVVQQKYKNRIRELTVGGFYGPGSKLGTSIEASDQAALTMDDDTFEDSYELDDDHQAAMVKAGETVLVRLLHKRGRAVGVTFSDTYTDGAHTVNIFNEPHRIYLRTLKDGTHVAAGQRLKERNKAIWIAALTSAAPILILAPIMLLVLLFALYKALKPLKKLEAEVNARKADDLTALQVADIPREVETMVQAINRLLARVADLRRREARFVADAAHELRSPMTVLNLQVERLAAMNLPQAARDQVNDLKRGLERATNMISQLLALKRAQAEEFSTNQERRANCLQSVSGVLEDLYWVAEQKNITLEVHGFDTPGFDQVAVKLTPTDLTTMVRNLLHNAVNYTPENGKVTVSAEQKNSRVVLTIADTGPGIAESERARVFDPFYRILGTQASGTGLGLAICKTIADRNHVKLDLDWTDPVHKAGLTVRIVLTEVQ